jgi:hypothetical protein
MFPTSDSRQIFEMFPCFGRRSFVVWRSSLRDCLVPFALHSRRQRFDFIFLQRCQYLAVVSGWDRIHPKLLGFVGLTVSGLNADFDLLVASLVSLAFGSLSYEHYVASITSSYSNRNHALLGTPDHHINLRWFLGTTLPRTRLHHCHCHCHRLFQCNACV